MNWSNFMPTCQPVTSLPMATPGHNERATETIRDHFHSVGQEHRQALPSRTQQRACWVPFSWRYELTL